jgi:transcriptional regulator of acetoin/glycerol metabolism
MGRQGSGLLQIGKAREAFLDGGPAALAAGVASTGAVSARIRGSWQRSVRFRVPHDRRDVPHVPADELDDRLTALIGPVLDRLADRLTDTGVGLLLSDADARILRRWSADTRIDRFFDRVQTRRGSQLSEDAVGTNGVGTPVVLGELVQVQGPEHVLDMYQRAVCTGAPVRDPVTGRILGAVTLTCALVPESGLLVPLLAGTLAEIERLLLDRATHRERELLDAFRAATRATREPVVALLGDTQVTSATARAALTPLDLALLEEAVAGLHHGRGPARVPVRLSGGRSATAVCTPAGQHERSGWVVRVARTARPSGDGSPAPRAARVPPLPGLVGGSPAWRGVLRAVEVCRRSGMPVLVTGEPGAGRTAVAVAMCGGRAVVHDAALEALDGTGAWLDRLRDRADGAGDAIVIRHLDALSPAAVEAAGAILDALRDTVTIVATTGGAHPDGAAAPLLDRFGIATIAVPPLRERPDDLPDLVRALARRHASNPPAAAMSAEGAAMSAEPAVALSAEALRALRDYPWPGNVRELETVVRGLMADRPAGPVPLSALPAEIVAGADGRRLTTMERVELDAIRAALRDAAGNRARAAANLGISRATLYRRLRAYAPLLDG